MTIKLQPIPSGACAKCGSTKGWWDNRDDKKNPKAPDFKCKVKECGDGIWLEKGAAWVDRVPQRSAAPQPSAPSIGNLPGWPAEQEQDEQRFVEQVKAQEDRGSVAFHELCRLHMACLRHVITHEAPALRAEGVATTDQGVSALAAQIFIEANRKGIVLPPVSRAA